MKERIVLDTNIVVRLMENNEDVKNALKQDAEYFITTLTMVEIIGKFIDNDAKRRVINILKKYKIQLLSYERKTILNKELNYFIKYGDVVKIKKYCLDEFASALSTYLMNFINVAVAHLYYAIGFKNEEIWKKKQLETEQNTLELFYLIKSDYIKNNCFTESFSNFFKEILLSFLELDENFKCPDDVQEITPVNLFKSQIKDLKEYRMAAETIPVTKYDITRFEDVFVQYMVKKTFINFEKIDINDLVDVTNLETGLFIKICEGYICKYYTCDKKSINLYKECFKNEVEVLEYIAKDVVIIVV